MFQSLYKNQSAKLKDEIKCYTQDMEHLGLAIKFTSSLCDICTVDETCRRQLEQAKGQLESEQLARRIAEENVADIDKEKTMLELEIKQLMNRYKHEILNKDITIGMVSANFIDTVDKFEMILF